MTLPTVGLIGICGVVLGGVVVATIVGGGDPSGTIATRPSAKEDKSQELTREPPKPAEVQPAFGTGTDARAAADRLAPRIPLPNGGNFNGIRWESAPGAVTPAQIDAVLEYNAACQWMRAFDDGREVTVAVHVLNDLGDWPGWRGSSDTRGFIQRAAAEAQSGGGADALQMLTDCRASRSRDRLREVARPSTQLVSRRGVTRLRDITPRRPPVTQFSCPDRRRLRIRISAVRGGLSTYVYLDCVSTDSYVSLTGAAAPDAQHGREHA
jgi:hypothetical protein